MTSAVGENYFRRRLRELGRQAEEWREEHDVEVPDEEAAMKVLRRGFGPTVSLYVEARTGGRLVRFTEDEFRRLEDTMNAWLEHYAWCYGYDMDYSYTVREAAELLVETRNARDAAEVLTGVPE